MRKIVEYQKELARFGYYKGELDGKFGPESLTALNAYRQDLGLLPVPDVHSTELLPALKALYPEVEKKVNTSNNWLSSFVASTAFKYVVAAVAGWLSNKLGLDPTEGVATVSGILSAAVSLAMLVWGAWESSRSKVVVNGTKVSVSQMTATDQKTVAAIAEKTAAK